MNRSNAFLPLFFSCFIFSTLLAQEAVSPADIQLMRQGVRRLIFDDKEKLPLAQLDPAEVIGLSTMFPVKDHGAEKANVSINDEQLVIEAGQEAETSIWLSGFNPFATYSLDLALSQKNTSIGFEFANDARDTRFIVAVHDNGERISDVRQMIIKNGDTLYNESIATASAGKQSLKGKLLVQLFGSGLTVFVQQNGLPVAVGQSEFSDKIDLRKKEYMHALHSSIYVKQQAGEVRIHGAEVAITTGLGQADIRAITYEDGSPLLEEGRLWYTMSIRGRALPHHLQGVFSLDPTVFDLKMEGVILFDRNDGLLRNEIASHIFYDRKAKQWRGLTTGFSAFASDDEEKQLLAVSSDRDPRFGFSVMHAEPFGIVGDIEDPHILYDADVNKWRILTCAHYDGYKAVILESDTWNKDYTTIAGPVAHNSTGTSIQAIGGKRYCFSGSAEREIFIYSYPELEEVGTLQMNLPPWDDRAGTRVWPNVVELPDGYPFKYVALMMDRHNYPGLEGNHWTYGALYLYHGM